MMVADDPSTSQTSRLNAAVDDDVDEGFDAEWQPAAPARASHGRGDRTRVGVDVALVERTAGPNKGAREEFGTPGTRDPFPYATSDKKVTRGIWAWLRGDRVMIWVVALLIGQAIARIVSSLMEDVLEPIFNRAFNDPDNEHPTVSIFGAKIRVRHFLMALFQFILIIVIAYAFSSRGAFDPAFFQPHDA